jgi:hypothetical protein
LYQYQYLSFLETSLEECYSMPAYKENASSSVGQEVFIDVANQLLDSVSRMMMHPLAAGL